MFSPSPIPLAVNSFVAASMEFVGDAFSPSERRDAER